MSRSEIFRRSVFAAGLVLSAWLLFTISAVTWTAAGKVWWRATGAEHALMLSGSVPSAADDRHATASSKGVGIPPVPEPGVIASLIGGVALLLSLRRRG